MDKDECNVHELHGKLQNLAIRWSAMEQEVNENRRRPTTGKLDELSYQTEDRSASGRPGVFNQSFLESTSMLLRYTEKTLGVAEDKLAISPLPYNVETYYLGPIRLVSIQKDYVPHIPQFFHSNIVTQYGLLETKNHGYFLMLESTIGTSVKEHLEEKNPTEEMKVLWVCGASNGLNYLHSLNFWYGELSLDRMHIHGSTLKLEHPAICESNGQGVEQDLQELCKLIKKISTDERLSVLVGYIESSMFTYDPELEVAKMTVDPDLDIYPENALGKFEVLQTVESSGQGYYLLCKNMSLGGYFGPVLVKYLGGRNEITRQFRDYSGVGVSAAVATQIRLAEDEKNSEREITFARELFHENIVRILGFFSPDGKPDSINAIIMEGDFDGNLELYASRKQIPLPDVKAFALQLASALEYCHSLDIMHRDVRARNIYVHLREKRIKLGNFGYARVGDQGNIYTANKGEELYYRAPEMISGHAVTEYTISVDVYGFALVLWSMLHGGRKPYKDDPECEKLVRNETKFKQYLEKGNRPMIDDNVDQELANLIKKCWINETECYNRPSMSSVVQTLQNM